MSCDCPECVEYRMMRQGPGFRKASKRAKELLKEHLKPEQWADFDKTGRFNVRGSDGRLYRVRGGSDSHDAVIRLEDDWGTSVWCQYINHIAADNALGLMIRLQAHASVVLRSGCHDYLYSAGAEGRRIGDYEGAI